MANELGNPLLQPSPGTGPSQALQNILPQAAPLNFGQASPQAAPQALPEGHEPIPPGFFLESIPAQTGSQALPEGHEPIPPGFILEPPQAPQQAPPRAAPPSEKPGVADLFTGESRTTALLESLPEIGDAPELNALSVSAALSSFGLLLTSDEFASKDVLKKQFGDEVSFTQDAKGNTIVNFPSGQFALNKPGFSPQDLAKSGFDLAAFSPAAKAVTVTKAALQSGATETLLETLEAAFGGEFDPTEIITSGLLGGFFKGAEDLIGAGYRAVKGKLASNVVEAGEEAGIPVLTSDTLENQAGITKLIGEAFEKVPFVGTGGLRAQQQVKREAAVNDVAERYGQFSYEAIIDSLKTRKDKFLTAAGNVLETTGSKLDEVGRIPLGNTKKAILVAQRGIGKEGVIKSTEATRDLNRLIEAINEAPQSFTTLTENRTAFKEILKGIDKAERTQLGTRNKALLTSIESAMKKDLRAMATDNLTPNEVRKWERANAFYFKEAIDLTKSQLKNVLDKGDVTPESVKTMLFSQKPSELKLLFNGLTTEGRANARSAIISDVTQTLNKRAAGLTPDTFVSEMKRRGLSVNTFFRGEQRKQLNGLLEVLEATRRAQASSVTTASGQALLVPGIAAVGISAGGAIPIAATATLGLMGNVYESPAVRNALIRLASLKKGSTEFEQALREATEILATVSQAEREQLDIR